MTPDPLPVALPELPTVAWMYRNGRHLELVEQRNDLLFPKHGEELVRKSDALVAALAALRAQAEEVERLRALLLDARLFAESCPADMGRGSLNGMRVHLLHAIHAHLAASKREKPHG